jgi:membrane protease subunit HflK
MKLFMSWNKGDGGGPWGKPSGGGSSGGGRGPNGGGFPPPNSDQFDELLRKSQERFKDMFSGDGGNKKMALVSILVLALLWMGSGIYQVQPGEVGVVMRFGKFAGFTEPGLRYHFPTPIESVDVVNVGFIRTEEFSQAAASGLQPADENASGRPMLTGDENIINVNFTVQWKISDAKKYLFNVSNPELTVRNVSESAIREVIGKNTFTSAFTGGKSQIEEDAKKLIQSTLDLYNAGIAIDRVNLRGANPPEQVIDAMRDVQAARADQERSRNEAEAYRNDIIPKARGQAERMLQEAEAYKQQVIAGAQGDSARFVSVYNEYRLAPEVTRKRIYLETMERVMTGMNKVVLGEGKNTQGVLPYMPIQGLSPRTPATPAAGGQ